MCVCLFVYPFLKYHMSVWAAHGLIGFFMCTNPVQIPGARFLNSATVMTSRSSLVARQSLVRVTRPTQPHLRKSVPRMEQLHNMFDVALLYAKNAKHGTVLYPQVCKTVDMSNLLSMNFCHSRRSKGVSTCLNMDPATKFYIWPA